MYLLRNYLRLCMPITIEAEINTSTTLVQRDAPLQAMQPLVVQATAAPRALLSSIPSGGAIGPLPNVGTKKVKTDVTIPGAKTDNTVESRMTVDQFEIIQANLCVDITDRFDDATRQAIRQAKLGARQSSQELNSPPLFDNVTDEIKSSKEAEAFLRAGTCKPDTGGAGYLTAFEKFRLPGPIAINGLRARLSKCLTTLPALDSGVFDQPMRDAIMTLKMKATGNDKAKAGDPKSGALNDQSYNYILKACTV
jgi:hypothetical protein